MSPARFGERAPRRELAQVVARVSWSVDQAPPYGPVRVLPDGGTDLLIAVSLAGGDPRAQVFGVKARALLVDESEPLAQVALHLRPGAAARALGIDASELRDQALALEELWSAARAHELVQRVQRARDLDAALAAAEDALAAELAHWRRRDANVALVDAALDELVRTAGTTRIAELCRALRVSERRLERAFERHVGLSPKAFARTLRFQRARALLRRGLGGSQVAQACGYADQAHLTREFVALAGVAPSRYARSAAPA